MSNNNKVLVTGSDGQLGRTLQKSCLAKNSFEWIFLPKEKLDITNINEIRQYLKSIIQVFVLIVPHSQMY